MCYHTGMKTRRAQTPIMIRSDKAATILARHVRPGRSQATVIEQALDMKFGNLSLDEDLEVRRAELEAVLDEVDHAKSITMAEFDALEYDEFGLCR